MTVELNNLVYLFQENSQFSIKECSKIARAAMVHWK